MDPRTGLPVVGMIGGGQLARMTHQAAIALGQSLRVLSVGPDESAALVTPDVVLGTHTDLDALLAFAADCDVVTFDHEHVPGPHIDAMVAAGHRVFPGSDALQFAQDKALMRRRLTDLGAPVPRWTAYPEDAGVEATLAGIAAFGDEVGWPQVLKATRGGYDGRGVWVVDDLDAAREVVATGVPLMSEELVPLQRELAALVARSPFGQGAAYPVVETVQRDGICVEVIAPAPDLDPDLAAEAEHLALRLAGELGVVGLLAVELFVVRRNGHLELVVNELAMRPHNSGHWTMDGARTSQFEQHLRAVLDYPLGATAPLVPWTVMANVIGAPAEVEVDPATVDERLHHLFARWPDVKVHLYGKHWRPGRKVGHVNAVGDDLDDVRARARAAADYLMHGGPHG